MAFIAPLALIGAAILAPIIVAMYLLKLRRAEQTVSSTFLWQRMVRDVEANAPWQKLRPNWLLLLQLLILLLLVLALARPFFATDGITGRNLVLIVDRSASMGATDVDADRLAAAKAQAIALIDQLPDGGRATVIAAGGQMEVPASATTDRRELRTAIESITLDTSGTSDLSQPLTLASALVSREENSEVAIISDGNVTFPPDLEVPATVRYFPIGTNDANAAVTAIVLQPAAAGQTLFVRVTNYDEARPATRRLDVFLDGELFNAYNLQLEPGDERTIIEEVPAEAEIAEARLNAGDDLAIDDQAWAVSALGDATTVRLVTDGNRFLTTALELLPGIVVNTVPADTAAFTETAAQVPVTIFDGAVPDDLPPGNLWFIAPPRSSDLFTVNGIIEFPSVRPVPGDDPLLQNTTFSDVSILEAVDLEPGGWARTVIDSDGAPLLVAGERDGRRIVITSFDLLKSDLPLQVTFPLLLSNIMTYLSPTAGAEAGRVAPGEPLTLPIDDAITEVRVTLPDDTRRSTVATGGLFGEEPLELENGQLVFTATNQPGVYTVEEFRNDELEARHRYAVNLFAPEESRITPQEQLAIQQASGLQTAITRDQAGRQEFWRWLAAIALIILLVEWLVYQRSALTNLRTRWQQWRHQRQASKSGMLQ